MNALRRYLAGRVLEPPTSLLSGAVGTADVGASSPASSGLEKSHSIARSALPSCGSSQLISEHAHEILTVSVNALRAWAEVKPMSAIMEIWSAEGSGPAAADPAACRMGVSMSDPIHQTVSRRRMKTYLDPPCAQTTTSWQSLRHCFLSRATLFDIGQWRIPWTQVVIMQKR